MHLSPQSRPAGNLGTIPENESRKPRAEASSRSWQGKINAYNDNTHATTGWGSAAIYVHSDRTNRPGYTGERSLGPDPAVRRYPAAHTPERHGAGWTNRGHHRLLRARAADCHGTQLEFRLERTPREPEAEKRIPGDSRRVGTANTDAFPLC